MTEDSQNAVSRRNFIKGVIAAGAAVSSASYLFRTATVSGQQTGAAGAVERLITLNVNGQNRPVDVMKQETLAMTLRYKLGLTGTKLGCDRAECGACTVLIDDVPHYSCSILTHSVRGKKVMTIEGLAAADGTLHPVQQGVVDEQGFQCAFCMPGFVMATVGYLKTNPNPTRQELAHGVSGNLCRCQDYDKILTALGRGAELMREGVTMAAKNKLVGQNYQTPDLVAKVTGQAKYSEDFKVDGMLFAKMLCSPMPHARVKSLDVSAALAMPGVKAILTADDLPAPADIVTDLGQTIKANPKGEKALTNEPLYFGEPILAVAAIDEETAAEAIEKIQIEFEPLPHVVDPLVSLRPGGPNPREEGNYWGRPASQPGQPPAPVQVQELKWTEADFAEYDEGKLPMGKTPDEWSFGDVEAGFKNAALVLDETFVTPNTSHQTLEPRSVLSYWQNGKLYVHAGTQSTIQTVASISRWMRMDAKDIVFISEYTGGGFGSKATGTINVMIPALLSKKANAPVMHRITRDEEHSIGGARPSLHGRAKVGFDKEGRITAIDMFVIGDNGPYEQGGDTGQSGRIVSLLYQPQAMRWRGVAILTNTPPRRAQSQPGGMQGITIMEPILAKAGRKLGIDQVAIRRINAPAGKAQFGPPNPRGQRTYATSSFMKEALDKGVEMFNWNERMARSGKRTGTKVRGTGVAMSTFVAGSTGFDALFVIRPDGRMYIHTGIGNLGTEAFSDVHRVAAEMMGMPWEKCELVFGNSTKNLPWSCVSGGSQTIHAHTRAAHAAATDGIKKVQEIAAKTLGGSPDHYTVSNERVSGGGRSMSLADVAKKAIELGGKYDGHETAEDINAVTKSAVKGLVGQGLMGVARDNYKRDGASFSFVAGFAEVEIDVETGAYQLVDYLAVVDVGTVIHPRALGGQVLGRSVLGMGHALGQKWVYDQHYGVPLAVRFYQNRPPTILDVPSDMKWAALDIPDPETPVGARGIGEPPVAAGCCAILNAISAAVGDEIFRRAPVNADTILTSLEAGKPVLENLTAHI